MHNIHYIHYVLYIRLCIRYMYCIMHFRLHTCMISDIVADKNPYVLITLHVMQCYLYDKLYKRWRP